MVIMHSVSKHVRLSELTVKIWMKIDLYSQRQRCSLVTQVSVNIRFVPIFEGVHWREGVKPQSGNRKHGFIRLSTLRLQHAKKWDERYCIPCCLSTDPELADSEWLECLLYVTVQCLRPKRLSDIFQFRIHSAFASFRTWILNDSTEARTDRKQA